MPGHVRAFGVPGRFVVRRHHEPGPEAGGQGLRCIARKQLVRWRKPCARNWDFCSGVRLVELSGEDMATVPLAVECAPSFIVPGSRGFSAEAQQKLIQNCAIAPVFESAGRRTLGRELPVRTLSLLLGDKHPNPKICTIAWARRVYTRAFVGYRCSKVLLRRPS